MCFAIVQLNLMMDCVQHYEVEFLMHQRWEDPRLGHDDGGRHLYLNGIHHHADIWKPDIYFIKHGTFKAQQQIFNFGI